MFCTEGGTSPSRTHPFLATSSQGMVTKHYWAFFCEVLSTPLTIVSFSGSGAKQNFSIGVTDCFNIRLLASCFLFLFSCLEHNYVTFQILLLWVWHLVIGEPLHLSQVCYHQTWTSYHRGYYYWVFFVMIFFDHYRNKYERRRIKP